MRYKVIVAYDGSKFIGWQVNPTGVSVLSTLNRAFKSVYREDIDLFGSGRTDKGVSASGQVFHFDAPFFIELDRLIFALNNQVHPFIHIKDIVPVDADFHARYHALWKHYRYSIECGPYNVLEADHIYQLNKELNIDLMQKTVELFIGTHDFTSFNTTTLAENSNQVRTIFDIKLKVEGTRIKLDFYGNGFLRYMIRMLTQTIIEVGLGRISIEKVAEMLIARNKGVCRYKAPAQGLTLMHVEYDSKYDSKYGPEI